MPSAPVCVCVPCVSPERYETMSAEVAGPCPVLKQPSYVHAVRPAARRSQERNQQHNASKLRKDRNARARATHYRMHPPKRSNAAARLLAAPGHKAGKNGEGCEKVSSLTK